ncbi:CPBP family intramembrane metalloprotease [Lysobacter sp. TY2-98]|uniref:CPBP family intramembrane glutamic endopeptidase n=1 Tax=Lysobacter sp. TY2-98 TaxID=2290922 RepID=UPI000E201193|nr:CPBP family intramembrane glutamic endopeptidase [Lysobacter sp. TY2-98]AXK72908.1 CPBP family intramembrane metalloprotease [Lysobacter sp. TY2-98]
MRSMSQRTECLLVLLVAFAMPVLSSMTSLIAPSTQPAITEDGLRSLIVYEAVVLLALLPLLRLRGWQRAHLGAVWNDWDLPAGALLTLVTLLACGVLGVLMQEVAHIVPPAPDTLVARDIPIATVALASMVNPLFEELFLCGYLVGVLKPARGTAFAVNASTALRLSYHLYQGAPSVLIIPVGLLFAAWYARTGGLWPVVIAHAAFDAMALAR